MLRNKSNAGYLDDVSARADADYNETVEMIEREKKIVYVALNVNLSRTDRPTDVYAAITWTAASSVVST